MLNASGGYHLTDIIQVWALFSMTEIIYFSKLYCAKTHKDPPISSLHLIDFVHSKLNQTVTNNNNLLWKFKKYFFVKIWIQLKAELLMCLLTYFTMDVFLSLKIDKNLLQFTQKNVYICLNLVSSLLHGLMINGWSVQYELVNYQV